MVSLYRNNSIAVVVPAYNEEELIGETLRSFPPWIDLIVPVNDASKDRTGEIIEEFAGRDPRIAVIHHTKNRGVGAAICAGYAQALEGGADVVAVMAGDNQMDPVYLPSLLDPIIDGEADYTKGNRLYNADYRRGMSTWRTFGNILLTYLTKIASGNWHIMDPQNGYTAASSELLESLDVSQIYPRYGYCNSMLVWLNIHGYRALDVLIPAKYANEKSKIRYSAYIPSVSVLLLNNFLWRMREKYVLLEFHPLVLFYASGAMLLFLGILGGVYSLYSSLFEVEILFLRGGLSLVIFTIGILFFLFAMFFDMQSNQRVNGR
ncbi:MAG: glycosyltransferase family 2 protein [Methanomicrobiaceae archaeon]|nr:glycosyltransferase family 2 protein [Methanomicrobiaceae archaeon]